MSVKIAQFSAFVLILGFCTNAIGAPLSDGFEGYYAPSNWSLTNSDISGDGAISTFTQTTLTFDGSNAGGGTLIPPNNTDVELGLTIPFDGLIQFDWDYSSVDIGNFDNFGYVLNGTYNQLVNNANAGMGSESISVMAGDTFSFRIFSEDQAFGAGVVSITNFGAPVPEPTTIALWSLLGMCLVSYRNWRKKAA